MVAEAQGRRSTTLAQLREWLTLIGAVVVVLGGLLGGVRLVVAPLYTEMRAMNGRLDRMEAGIRAGREETRALRRDMQDEFKAVRGEMNSGFEAVDSEFEAVDSEFKAVDSEFKAIREDLADIRERLTRVETLLERHTDPPGDADTTQ